MAGRRNLFQLGFACLICEPHASPPERPVSLNGRGFIRADAWQFLEDVGSIYSIIRSRPGIQGIPYQYAINFRRVA